MTSRWGVSAGGDVEAPRSAMERGQSMAQPWTERGGFMQSGAKAAGCEATAAAPRNAHRRAPSAQPRARTSEPPADTPRRDASTVVR
jgi:hypothetical protein